jgi:hypothetical protein
MLELVHLSSQYHSDNFMIRETFGGIKNSTFGYNMDIIQEQFILYNINKIYIIMIKYSKYIKNYKIPYKIIYNVFFPE